MENKETIINVIKALKFHFYLDGCCKDCPYFGCDYCVDKLVHDIIKLIMNLLVRQIDS